MARKYIQPFSVVTVSAPQDLIFLPGPSAGKMIRILRMALSCTDTAVAVSQMLSLRASLMTATVTPGSGGTTGLTPTKMDQGDTTCSVTTAGCNNTTQATTSGSKVTRYSGGCHLYVGHKWTFLEPVPVSPGMAFVYELLNTVSGTVDLSGEIEFEEIG